MVGGTGLVASCFDFGRCSLKERIYSSLVVRLHKVESVCIEKRKLGGSDSVSGCLSIKSEYIHCSSFVYLELEVIVVLYWKAWFEENLPRHY